MLIKSVYTAENSTIQKLCDKVCQRFAAGRWFSLGTPVSSTRKTDRHDIIGLLHEYW